MLLMPFKCIAKGKAAAITNNISDAIEFLTINVIRYN